MEEISTKKKEEDVNIECDMCLNKCFKYVFFSCQHKICFKCFYKILLRSYLRDITLNKEIKISCICKRGDLLIDLNTIYNNLNYLYENRSNFEEKFNDKCANHSNEKVKDFCLDCVEYLCDKCKEGKKFHFKHNIVNKDDYIKTIKENIGKLPDLNYFLEEYENNINKSFEEYSKEISLKFDLLINEIQNYKNKALNEIKIKVENNILPMKICLLLYKYYNYEVEKSSNDIHQLLFSLNTKIIIPEINYQTEKTEYDIDNIIKSINNLNLNKRITFDLNQKFGNFKIFQSIERAHNTDINCMIKLNGNIIVTGDLEGYIRLWKITGKGLYNFQTEKAHESQIQSIINLSNKKFSSCSGLESIILIWKENIENDKYKIIQKINLENKICTALNTLNDKESLLLALNDNKYYIYTNKNNEYIENGQFGKHEGTINCIIQLKNERIVTASDDKSIIIWNKKKRECKLTSHKDCVNVVIELNDNYICSGSSDKNIIIWKKNASSKFEKYLILEGHLEAVKCLIYFKDKRIISGSQDNIIKIWLLSRNNYICSHTICEHKSCVSGLVNFNNEAFISCSYDKTIKIWVYVKK